ncbi:hypothetical protein Trihar35433_11275 [Trichoderma harzianum]|nr:hypothetical protein Trihar35433_11275 [Trichoderma harzianum]
MADLLPLLSHAHLSAGLQAILDYQLRLAALTRSAPGAPLTAPVTAVNSPSEERLLAQDNTAAAAAAADADALPRPRPIPWWAFEPLSLPLFGVWLRPWLRP